MVVLVTLGGYHLLDGFVAYGLHCEGRVKIVRVSEGLVRGIVLVPRETQRATLVERGVKSTKWSSLIKC